MRAPVVSLACKVATGLMLFAVMGGFPLLASALDGASSDKIALDGPARSAAANHSLDDRAKASALPAFVAADGRAHLSVDAPIGTAGGLQVFEASVEHAGLAFALVGDGGSVAAALVGVEIASERVVVPPSIEVGGASYPVVRIAPGAVEGTFISAIVVPATVSLIDDGAFDKAPYLESVQVDSGNESYSSCDGVLYDAAMERLLLIPEGKQGPVRIPKTAKVVPPSAFSHCALVESIEVEAGGAAFSSWNGCLYDYEGKTLLRIPAGLGNEVEVASGCSDVAPGAFEGCNILRSLSGMTESLEVSGDGKDALAEETEDRLAELTCELGEKPAEGGYDSGIPAAPMLASAEVGVEEPVAFVADALVGLDEALRQVARDSGELATRGQAQAQSSGAAEGGEWSGVQGGQQRDSFQLTFVLDREPSRLSPSTGWLNDVEPPEWLSVDMGNVFINNPIRKGYRFVGWTDESGAISKVDASKSVIHCERLTEGMRFVARWSAVVSVDVPQYVRFEYADAPTNVSAAKEGEIVAEGPDGQRLATTFKNRTGEYDLAIVGLQSTSTPEGREMIVASAGSGKTDEQARGLKLLSMYPDEIQEGYDENVELSVHFALDDIVEEDEFPQAENAFSIPVESEAEGGEGLRVRFRLNLDSCIEGVQNFAALDVDAVQGGEMPLASVSYTFASADRSRADTYAVAWEGNGGRFGDGSSEVVDYCVNGQELIPPALPSREGYEFKGWASSVAEAEQGKVLERLPSARGEAAFYAAWVPRKCSVIWFLNDGTDASETTEQSYGSAIEAPIADPERPWFVFKGWSTAADSRDVVVDFGMVSEEGAAFYAVWKHEVLWRYNDGTDGGVKNEFWPDEKIMAPKDFNRVRNGYRFEGWTYYRDDHNRLMRDSDLPKAKDMLTPYVNACWSWGITWFMNNDDQEQVTLYHPQGKQVVAPDPGSKKGHTFAGWGPYAATNVQNAVEDLGISPPQLGDPPMTRNYLHGLWRLNTYTITWVDMRDPSSPTEVTTSVGHGAATKAPSMERQGYTLKGWALTAGGSTTSLPTNTTGAETYYAVWVPKTYTLTWKNYCGPGGDDLVTTQDYGTTVKRPAAPVHATRNFEGWSETQGGQVMNDLGCVTDDAVFYAKWSSTLKTYYVHFIYNRTETDSFHFGPVAEVEAGDRIFSNPKEVPSWPGHVFVGWSRSRQGDVVPYEYNENGDAFIGAALRTDGGDQIYYFAQWRSV